MNVVVLIAVMDDYDRQKQKLEAKTAKLVQLESELDSLLGQVETVCGSSP